ncbi:hypothetical protein [Helicobacter labacensis]|uniref:hypothetical protein n=1 Tax=Helicobacter labacensis TaxID=2316079 RepID=UPI000EB0102F|nr:hypothetical protein [Helicobacter labacensis]
MDISAQEEEILQAHEERLQYVLVEGQEQDAKGTCQPNRFYALIEDNAISDIFKGEDLPNYNPEQLMVLEIPQDQEAYYCVGLKLQEGKLVPMSLDQAKQRQLDLIDALFSQDLGRMHSAHIPLGEVLTFEKQYQEAITTDPTIPTPFIDALALARDEPRAILVKKIINKYEAYNKALTKLLGYRHRLRRAIKEAKSVQEVLNIEYKSPL